MQYQQFIMIGRETLQSVLWTIGPTLLAALLIGFVDTFGKVLLPQAAGVLVYVLMAVILLWKPDGLFKAG